MSTPILCPFCAILASQRTWHQPEQLRTNYITVSSGYTATTTVITYTYDPLNRLTNAAYSDDKFFTYAYDGVGNRMAYTETITQTVEVTELIALHTG